jgi:hypothetical protein
MAQAGVPACSLVDSLSQRQAQSPKASLREHARRSDADDPAQPGLHLRPPLHSTASSADRLPLPLATVHTAPAESSPSEQAPSSQDSTDQARGSERPIEPVVFDPQDLEAQRKWNEERIERRLRGEWERVNRRLADLVRFPSP